MLSPEKRHKQLGKKHGANRATIFSFIQANGLKVVENSVMQLTEVWMSKSDVNVISNPFLRS